MFFAYLWRELRRRLRQAVLIALGLALGVGLVITVTAVSDGVKASQATVLHTLYGTMSSGSLARAAALGGVSAVAGGLSLTDVSVQVVPVTSPRSWRSAMRPSRG